MAGRIKNKPEFNRKARLSVMVLTRNEEARIEDCLRSVEFADDVLVVDSMSSDRTVALARKMGARVIGRPWPGFTKQRNFAISKCRHDWILSIDADERVAPDLAAEICQLLEGDPGADGYRIRRLNNYHGKWLRHGGAFPDWHMLLFRKNIARFKGLNGDVHEGVETTSEGRLQGLVKHLAVPDIESGLAKVAAYTLLEAQGRLARGVQPTLYGVVWRPQERFFKSFVLKYGFLDGPEGFMYAAQKAWYTFLIEVRLWELKERNGFR